MSTFIIGISGSAGAGKNTVADHIIAKYGRKTLPVPLAPDDLRWGMDVRQYALADALKIETYDLLAAADFYSYRSGFLVSNRPQPRWNEARTDAEKIAWVNANKNDLRKMLQLGGTEWRRAQEPDYWVNRLLERIAEDSPQIAVITDVRFENELAICHAAVKVEQIGQIGQVEDPAVASHVSEREWRKHDFRDNVIRAAKGDLETLQRESERVFEQILTRFHVQ